MKKTILFAGAGLIFGCSDAPNTSNASPEQVAAIEAARTPPKPIHYYSMEENGEYGYERGLSEDDINAGKKTSALMMIRYMGAKDDIHKLSRVNGSAIVEWTCKSPCEFVKARMYFGKTLVEEETMRAAEGSLIWAMVQDAQHGFLQPYSLRKTSLEAK